MAKVFIEETTLTAIGDAIREKTGGADLIAPGNMPAEIMAIETGSGGGDLPEEAFKFTGNCTYMFAYDKWKWFIEQYGNKITTEGITNASYMFHNITYERIPFEINMADNTTSLDFLFQNATKLKELPKINLNITKTPANKYGFVNMNYMIYNASCLREIPEDYFTSFAPAEYWETRKTFQADGKSNMFYGLYSLRKLPNTTPFVSYGNSPYNSMYGDMCQNCYTLDEITNLTIESGPYTSNCFANIVYNCCRLKEFTFATQDDGTPYTANWKNQTLTFTNSVGNGTSSLFKNYILNYNSGITADKEVIDDATYQALKNDPDWFTIETFYSRYNHDSAVNTINSLPDTSAYGTNTIKFVGDAGKLTDGGAINTLTEEEIAVATAKGWTVSLT